MSCGVFGHGVDDPAGNAADWKKPAILEVSNPATGGDPDTPAIILIEGLQIVLRQSISRSIDRNLPIVPSVQAIRRAHPDAAILGCKNGGDEDVGQTRLGRNRGNG